MTQPISGAQPPPDKPEPAPVVQRVGIPEAMVSVFSALAFALSARLLLLLALAGAFVLALMAMQSQSYQSIGILIAYALLIVGPMVYLEARGNRPR